MVPSPRSKIKAIVDLVGRSLLPVMRVDGFLVTPFFFYTFFFYKITKSESQPGCSYGFGYFQAQMILKCS